MTATTTVRTTTLEVRFTAPGGSPVLDDRAFSVSCSFGFDQRYAEATVRRTGGGSLDISYWDAVEIRMGATPGAGAAVRFAGYVVPVDNALFPIEGVVTCKGRLYRAEWVRNQTAGGTNLPGATGATDQAMVQQVLNYCQVPFTAANVSGTGETLGAGYVNWDDPLTPGPFTWGEGESGLALIQRLDEVSVPDDYSGRYRTFESLGGDVYRIKLATTPTATPDFSFTEGVDVLEAKITRDPTGAANRVVVTGAPLSLPNIPTVVGAQTYTASSPTAPYLPPGLPNGPEGYPSVAMPFASPLLEKSTIAAAGTGLSCEQVARFLLGEYNCVVDTLEFSTPRDDLLGPGQTIHLDSPRLAITDPAQHYWLQRLEITLDERGALTQRLTCIRKS